MDKCQKHYTERKKYYTKQDIDIYIHIYDSIYKKFQNRENLIHGGKNHNSYLWEQKSRETTKRHKETFWGGDEALHLEVWVTNIYFC